MSEGLNRRERWIVRPIVLAICWRCDRQNYRPKHQWEWNIEWLAWRFAGTRMPRG